MEIAFHLTAGGTETLAKLWTNWRIGEQKFLLVIDPAGNQTADRVSRRSHQLEGSVHL